MNTMINPEAQPTREELLKRVEELEQELNGKITVLAMASESLQSYKAEVRDWQTKHENLVESVDSLAHKHLDLEGTEFFDQIIDLFNIELTKTVTLQFKVSVEVQATVPSNMDDEEIEEELKSAKLDYEFLGNGDIEIEDFSFGDLEVN